MRALLWALVTPLLLPAVPCAAVDLTKVDRTIRSEPKHEGKEPRYCLVVFGPEAKSRVWLVRDGNTLYVDRNGNGKIGEPGERIVRKQGYSSFTVEQIIPSSSKDVTNKLSVSCNSNGQVRILFYGKQRQLVGFARHTPLHFSTTPEKAPIVHFNGPLTFGRYAERVTLRPNPTSTYYRKTSLRLMIGTAGLGPGTFAALHCRCRKNRGDLVASFEYPTSSGGTQRVQRVALKTYG